VEVGDVSAKVIGIGFLVVPVSTTGVVVVVMVVVVVVVVVVTIAVGRLTPNHCFGLGPSCLL